MLLCKRTHKQEARAVVVWISWKQRLPTKVRNCWWTKGPVSTTSWINAVHHLNSGLCLSRVFCSIQQLIFWQSPNTQHLDDSKLKCWCHHAVALMLRKVALWSPIHNVHYMQRRYHWLMCSSRSFKLCMMCSLMTSCASHIWLHLERWKACILENDVFFSQTRSVYCLWFWCVMFFDIYSINLLYSLIIRHECCHHHHINSWHTIINKRQSILSNNISLTIGRCSMWQCVQNDHSNTQ